MKKITTLLSLACLSGCISVGFDKGANPDKSLNFKYNINNQNVVLEIDKSTHVEFSSHQCGYYGLVGIIIPFIPHFNRNFRKTVAGQINKIDVAVYIKVINGLRFTGGVRNLRKFFSSAQIIDERTFAHIRATYKSKLRHLGQPANLFHLFDYKRLDIRSPNRITCFKIADH